MEVFRASGRKGGRATRDKTSPEIRRVRAVKAAIARWAKYRDLKNKGKK